MKRAMMAMLVAGSMSLGACATTNDPYYADRDETLRDAATGAAVGAATGAVAGAVIPGVSPVEGAVAGAVVGGVAGAVTSDNDRDGDGYVDEVYYDRNGDGYYDGKYDSYGRPIPVKANTNNGYRSGERG